MLFLVVLIGIVSVPSSSLADNTNLQSWTWQKGIETYTQDNTTAVEMDLTIPTGEIDSKGNLHNYVWAYTNTGNFIQVGIVYKDAIVPQTGYHTASIFYSDGVLPFYLNETYVEGHHYRFAIYFNNGWTVYVKDDVTGKENSVTAKWAHGNTISQGGVFLESIGLDPQNIINTTPEIGTLSNIKDETFNVYTNGNWISVNPSNFATPESSEKVGTYIVNYIHPPTVSVFMNSGDGGYEVGFSEHNSLPITTPTTPTPQPISAVPEFGSLTGMIILISTIGVLTISRKFRFHF
jgi:hypothetical protein